MMAANSKARWVWLCGAAAVVAIVVASLIPAKMQVRTGLSWQVAHFLVYFTATSIFASPLHGPSSWLCRS
jgi:NhaP-type Na+/H+ or K+/H+ antiporter